MNDASDPCKSYHFLKECNEKFQMHIFKFFNRLRFLVEVSTKLQTMHFSGQFKDHKSGRKHGSQTNDPIFHLLFPL